jgi:hypothetical protein
MAQSEIAETKEAVVVKQWWFCKPEAERWEWCSRAKLKVGVVAMPTQYRNQRPLEAVSKLNRVYRVAAGGEYRLLGTPKRGWPSQQTESYKNPPPRSRSSTAAQIILRDIMLLVSINYCVCWKQRKTIEMASPKLWTYHANCSFVQVSHPALYASQWLICVLLRG